MVHAFLLVVLIGGDVQSNDMYFRSVTECNFFAAQVTKRYGNYTYYSSVPKEHKVTAYCKPVKVNKDLRLY